MAEPKVHNYSTYNNHGCRCATCRAAAAASRRSRVRQNRAARIEAEAAGRVHVVEGITHGESGFCYWNCRCDTCRSAHNQVSRTNRLRRVESSTPKDVAW